MTTSALPWVEKYRPQSLSHIVHHDTIIQLLRVFIRSRQMPHLFFYGPPGTGKTSTILSCAREIYGKHHSTMVLHLNASDERGIDVVRKQVIQFASTANFFCADRSAGKLVILDEADSMTHAAQIALRDIMMAYDTLFCLIGNYQYALLPPLQSRVVRLLFTPIPEPDALALGVKVLAQEGFHEVSTTDLAPVYAQTGGDMRQFLNVLQAIAMRSEDNTTTTTDTTDTTTATTTTTKNAFQSANVRRLLCHWDESEVHQMIQRMRTQSIADCYKAMHASIVDTHSHTLQTWIGALGEALVIGRGGQKGQGEPTEKDGEGSLEATLDLCTTLATIEYHASVALYPEVQLFGLVGCCHRFVRGCG